MHHHGGEKIRAADLPASAGKSASFSTVFLEEYFENRAANRPAIRGSIFLPLSHSPCSFYTSPLPGTPGDGAASKTRVMWPKRIRKCAALMALAGVSATGQVGARSVAITRVEVNGRVINSVTNEPVRRALVEANEQAMLADGEGRFHFEVLDGIYLRISARKPGFLSDEELRAQRNPREVLPARIGDEPLILKLTPQAVIAGSVSAADGEPLERVRIRALYEQIVEGRKTWQSRFAGITDEDGEFRIANLPPGDFYLVADAKAEGDGLPLGLAARAGEARGYATTYYPNAPDQGSATVIHLAAGEQKRADFLLRQVPLYSVSGVVANIPQGGNAMVQITRMGMSVQAANPEQSSGKFQLRAVPAGTYIITANGADGNGNQFYAEREVAVNGEISNLLLTLESGVSIPINVQRIVARTQQRQSPFTVGQSSRLEGGRLPHALANAGVSARAGRALTPSISSV